MEVLPKKIAPFGSCPNRQQLLWQEMGIYAFIHFTVNTFTDREWGVGDESPDLFNPVDLDCDGWCKALAEAGFKGAVLTCKHHDGFCIWPSKYTTHSVKYSKWRDGQGDVVREFTDAARKYDLKVGFYLSPWDRHDERYGKGEEYNEFFRNQLRELLENYGGEDGEDVFMTWFDGAIGEEERKQEYDFKGSTEIIRECAPNAVIMGHMGDYKDIRWCGNEAGFAGNPNWATFSKGVGSLQHGNPAGDFYWPSEADVSIRPGWFYHESENQRIKSLESLIDIYYTSVGRGSCLNLNIPPAPSGKFHPDDIRRLQEWSAVLKRTFATDFAAGKKAHSNQEDNEAYSAAHMLDGQADTFWALPEDQTTGEAVIELGSEQKINVFKLCECSELGERVEAFELYSRDNQGEWILLAQDHTISFNKLVRTETVKTDAIKLKITKALASPCLKKFGAYYQAPLLLAPKIRRCCDGILSIESGEDLVVHYTLDGTQPTIDSPVYDRPISFPDAGTIRAITVLKAGVPNEYEDLSLSAPEAYLRFGLAQTGWEVTEANGEYDAQNLKENILVEGKCWISPKKNDYPHYFVIDTKRTQTISGLIYQVSWLIGAVENYRIRVDDQVVHEGSFDNIVNNPVPQIVEFATPAKGRYVKFEALSAAKADSHYASCSRLEIF